MEDNNRIILDIEALKEFLNIYTPEAEIIEGNGIIEIEHEGFAWTVGIFE